MNLSPLFIMIRSAPNFFHRQHTSYVLKSTINIFLSRISHFISCESFTINHTPRFEEKHRRLEWLDINVRTNIYGKNFLRYWDQNTFLWIGSRRRLFLNKIYSIISKIECWLRECYSLGWYWGVRKPRFTCCYLFKVYN